MKSAILAQTLSSSAQKQDRSRLPVVLITGASTGIGQHCATYLAQAGLIVLAGHRSDKAARELSDLHANIHPVRLDVTNPEDILAARHWVESRFKNHPFGGLINNAGIVVGGPVEAVPLSQWRTQLEVNLLGHIQVIQTFMPLLREHRGRIINMGSVAGIQTLPFISPYSVSKFGLAAISDALRVELRPWGIQVSLIEPGSVRTPIWEKSTQSLETSMNGWPAHLQALYSPALHQVKAASHQSAQKSIHPEAIAKAVHHALTARHPKSRYPIGMETRLRRYMSWLPDRLKDWIIQSKLGV